MIDHKQSLLNLSEGKSHIIPDRDRVKVQPDWRIPETRAERVREGDPDALYEDGKFVPAIRHVYVAEHPPEPEPEPPPPSEPEEPWPNWIAAMREAEHDEWLIQEAVKRMGGARVVEPEPAPAEPEHHFADLMLADETLDDAKARLSQRLRELRHYLIAPEIKVNEDGSVGLTGEEQAELQDLERRQTLGRWLDA